MNNSLPNSYLFSRYNDFGLSEKNTVVISSTKDTQNNQKVLNSISDPCFSNLLSWK